jgi:hypothetical protein
VQVLRTGIAVSWLALLASSAGAQPAMSPAHSMASGPMPSTMQHMQAMDGPTQPGQAAFGAIQEIVGMLQADPRTDWSKVDIDALRQHLIDMDAVTMRADAHKEPVDNGLRIEITGTGRTLEAIRRMVPAHAHDIDGMNGWTVRTEAMSNGVVLTVTAINAAEVQKIRALGFMGIMVQGTHQPHHLAMARGEPMSMHHQMSR